MTPVHPIALRLVRKHQGVDLGVGGRILGGGEGAGVRLPGGVVGEGDGPALQLGCEIQQGDVLDGGPLRRGQNVPVFLGLEGLGGPGQALRDA